MPARVLHTADWQLGKRFGRVPGDAGALLREQRLATVDALGALARAREVDAVLVAGDVFEMNTVEEGTLRRTLHALARHPVPWVLLPGNHDAALAESVWTRLARLGVPDHVHLAVRPEPILLAGGRLAVLPAPLTRRHEPLDVTAWMDGAETPAGAARVGLAHGSVQNRLPERGEAQNPISDTRADDARLDYLALGDWHGTLEIAPRTFYAGTPEPDRFRGNDPGNVLVVDLPGPGEPPRVERVRVGHYLWERRTALLTGPRDLDALAASLEDLPSPHERVVLELALEGVVDLATRTALDELLEGWSARVRHLSLRDEHLVARATDDDLDAVGRSGFLQEAIATLRAIETDPESPDQGDAGAALQLLYLLGTRGEG